MIVSDLIRLLQACDPDAVVLIPNDIGLGDGSEMLSGVVAAPAERFSSGPAASRGAVRLLGFPALALASADTSQVNAG